MENSENADEQVALDSAVAPSAFPDFPTRPCYYCCILPAVRPEKRSFSRPLTDVLSAVAEVLAASVRVGALPSCDVSAEVSRLGGQVLAVARKDGSELARASAAIG